MNEKELLKLKEQIDQAKTRLSELHGREEYLTKELNTTWNCKTTEEANILIGQLTKKIDKLDEQIRKGIAEVEKRINERQGTEE